MRPPRRPADQAARQAFFDDLIRRVAGLLGVETAAVADGLPVSGPDWGTRLRLADGGDPIDTGVYRVSPEYFRLFRIPLIAGRGFEERDSREAPKVVIVSETAARTFFPGENAIGRRIPYPSSTQNQAEIVGVVGDVKYRPPGTPERSVVYCSAKQDQLGDFFLMARAGGGLDPLVSALRDVVRALDSEAPVFDVRTMDQRVASVTSRTRFSAFLLALMAVLALGLAALGIYGVFAYSVAARTHDIGIRMAMGASHREIRMMILREGALLCAISLAVGLPAALALTRVLSSQLFQVKASDPLTFAVVSVVLTVVALAACYFPARRATKIDPIEALRYE